MYFFNVLLFMLHIHQTLICFIVYVTYTSNIDLFY